MFVIALTAQIDRQIMALVASRLKAHLHLGDDQIGVLLGFGFSLTYALCSVFMAYLGDRYSRKKVLAIGLVVWSMLTGACAFASSFISLLIARLGVGVGESVLTPTAYPMVSSAFPPERRSLPIALIVAASPAGLIVAPLLIGFILHAADNGAMVAGIIGTLAGFQIAFLVCAGLGLTALVLLLLIRQPSTEQAQGDNAATVSEALGYFLRRPRYFAAIFFAMPILAIPNYALVMWMPMYFERAFGLDVKVIAVLNSFGFVPAALIAPFLAAGLGRFSAKSENSRMFLRIMFCMIPAVGISVALPMLMPSALSASIAFAFPMVATQVVITFSMINVQHIVPLRYRSHASAIAFALFVLIGSGFGPTIAGIFAARVVEEGRLDQSLLLCVALFVPAAALICWNAVRAREPDGPACSTRATEMGPA